MLGIQCHSVIAFALSDVVASHYLVCCRINHRKNVPVLQVDVDLARNWIVLRHPGFTVEMQSLDNPVLLNINDGFGLASLVGNVELMERSGIGAAIRLSFRRQLLDHLHLFQVDDPNRIVPGI